MFVMRKISAKVILFAGNSDPMRNLVIVRFEIGIGERERGQFGIVEGIATACPRFG
jgi:hypothetical protein